MVMVMRAAELILSVLGSSARPIEGRTAIQKIVYFASIETGIDIGYKPHFYGPYCSSVARLLENLVSMDYIAEKQRLTAHDRTMYSYFLTDDGEKLVNEIRKREPRKYEAIKKVVGRCQKIVKNNIHVLSWAAKVYFLLSQKGAEISYKEAKEMSKRFGWQLSTKEIESGAKLLVSLGLVKKSKRN